MRSVGSRFLPFALFLASFLLLPTVRAANVVANGDFSGGTSPWAFYSNGSAGFGVVNGEARIAIDVEGSNVQLFQRGLNLKGGTEYRLTFRGRNSGDDDVQVKLHGDSTPHSNYGLLATFDLSSADQSFSTTFTTTAGDKTDARLAIWMAPYDQNGHTYFFDDVRLDEISDRCGDGVVDTGEECDDGNNDDGDTCRSDCTLPVPVVCGDGIVAGAEVCDDGNTVDGDGCPADCNPLVQLETVVVSVGGATVTVPVTRTYVNPVVVCSAQYAANSLPIVTRVSNVTPTSFDVRLQNPSDRSVVADNVHCLVVEEGVWDVEGLKLEAFTAASTVTDENSRWAGQLQSYGQVYANPVVLGQVMTENDPDWSVFWSSNGTRGTPPSATSIRTGKHVGADPGVPRAAETIGVIVLEAGHGTLGDIEYEVAVGTDTVKGVRDSPPYGYTFATTFSTVPTVAVVSQSAMDGGDGSWGQVFGASPLTTTTLHLSVDEEQLADLERSHTHEQVAYAVFAGDLVYPITPSCVVDADCDDTLYCNGDETCNAGTCQTGTPVVCNDGVGCTVDTCNETTDTCDSAASDAACDNGLFCDGAETCDAALDCQAGTPPPMDDGVACTVDGCDEVNDVVIHAPDDGACDNGLFCDGAETCDPVDDCQGAADPCAAGACDEDLDRCVCVSDLDCDDGSYCNGEETCDGVSCRPGADPCAGQAGCDDVNDQCITGPVARLETHVVNVGSTFQTVVLSETYVSPVVVCSAQYAANSLPIVTRVSSVTPTSFDVRLQNPSDRAVVADDVHCLVVEEGVWVVDGLKVEAFTTASTVTDENSRWVGQMQSYGQTYTKPVVLGQVMTQNDPDWSVFWSSDGTRAAPPSTTSIRTGKHVGADPDITRATETIGVIVLESGHGTLGDIEYEVAVGTDTVAGAVNSPPYSYTFATPFSTVPAVAVVSQAAMDGGDGSWAQVFGASPLTTTTLHLSVDEEQLADAERSHTHEQVAYAVFAGDLVYPPVPSCVVDADCDDTLYCNGAETCSAGTCEAGTPVVCDDGVGCTVDTCNETTDSCDSAASDAACDNGSFCDGAETCDAALDCQAGTPPPMDDGVACTVDSCDEANDVVVHTPDDGQCDNTVFCDGAKICDPVEDCQVAADPCAPGACDEGLGQCVCGDETVQAGEECDDGAENSDVNSNACRTNCRLPWCGDGVVDDDEGCDDGNDVPGDGCSAGCGIGFCGNDVMEPGEECDDGNSVPGDGCDESCRMEPANVLVNGDFAAGPAPWRFYSNGAAAYDVATGEAVVHIETPGSNVQLYQLNLALESDTRYRLRFVGRNLGGDDVDVRLHEHLSPYTNYGLVATFDLTPESTVYEVDFTTTGSSITNARLSFRLSPYDSSGDHYFFDDVVLRKVLPDVLPPSIPVGQTATAYSSTRIDLAWAESVDDWGVAGYCVLRDGAQVAEVTESFYNDTGLNPSTAYVYSIVAFDDAENASSPSAPFLGTTRDPDPIAPTPPSGLEVVLVSSTRAELGWSPATDNVGVVGYDVIRNGSAVATTSGLSYSDFDLQAATEYIFQISARDADGNESAPSEPVTVTTDDDPFGTVIDVWYGSRQPFGMPGVPQRWVNVLGNATDPDGLQSLDFALNGGPFRTLTIGTDNWTSDGRRLQREGDFNVEIDFAELIDGDNTVLIRAEDSLGNVQQRQMIVEHPAGTVWPLPYAIDWSAVTDLQDVVQVVDGKWSAGPDGVRTVEFGYDRLLAIGDETWDDYEVVVRFFVHERPDETGGWKPGLGLIMRWTGHTDTPIYCPQPHCGWRPTGNSVWYVWPSYQGIPNSFGGTLRDPTNRPLDVGVHYYFKVRGETLSPSEHVYKFKLWADGELEPIDWTDTGLGDTSMPRGSIVLIAHFLDVSFEDVRVSPLPDTESPDAPAGLVAGSISATEIDLSWDAADDNVQVTKYMIYRDGQEVGLTNRTSVSDDGLIPGTEYTYSVTALDDSDNESDPSATATATTTVAGSPAP